MQIKDKDIANEFSQLVTTQLLNYLAMREKRCSLSKHFHNQGEQPHKHHTHKEHHKFEIDLLNKLSITRKKMLDVQKVARQFKF